MKKKANKKQDLKYPVRTLSLEFTFRVEDVKGEMLPVWQGTDQDGTEVRIWISKYRTVEEDIKEKEDEKQKREWLDKQFE